MTSACKAIIFDLDEEPDMSIVRTIRPSQLPPEIYSYLNPRVRVSYFVETSPSPLASRK